jgi:hypothetical protein
MSVSKPDRLERWFLERFRLRASLRSAWEAVRVRDEVINVNIKALQRENIVLRSHISMDKLHDLQKARKIS